MPSDAKQDLYTCVTWHVAACRSDSAKRRSETSEIQIEIELLQVQGLTLSRSPTTALQETRAPRLMLTSPPMTHVMMLQRLLMLMMMMALPAVHARCRQQDRQKGRGKGGKTDRQTKTAGGRGGAGAIKGTKLDLLLSRWLWRLD